MELWERSSGQDESKINPQPRLITAPHAVDPVPRGAEQSREQAVMDDGKREWDCWHKYRAMMSIPPGSALAPTRSAHAIRT